MAHNVVFAIVTRLDHFVNYRVEFHSPGRAPNTVDEEAMRAGAHVVRNPHIYARLSDAGLVTGAGTGIPRMVRLVRQATNMDVQIAVTRL
jgi:predicted HTH transcriptional regulator